MNFEEFYPLFCEDNGIAVGGQYSEEIEDYCLLSFQAGAASRDAEVAELQKAIDENWVTHQQIVAASKERDQLRAELVKALAACKAKDEALEKACNRIEEYGFEIGEYWRTGRDALAIQPDDSALKAWLGEAVAWKDAAAKNRIIFPPTKPEDGDDGWLPLYSPKGLK